MPDLPVVQALYDIPVDQLEPLRIWQVVQEQLGPDFRPVKVDELEQCLADMQANVEDGSDRARGRALTWKWMMGMVMVTLRRVLDGENMTILELTHAIDHSMAARRWRIETLGYDRVAAQRARAIDVCARLMMQVGPDDWLSYLVTRPVGNTPDRPGLATRIKRRRQAMGLTITELAHRANVQRTTASRWEQGKTVPHPPQREALAKILGGEPSDYA